MSRPNRRFCSHVPFRAPSAPAIWATPTSAPSSMNCIRAIMPRRGQPRTSPRASVARRGERAESEQAEGLYGDGKGRPISGCSARNRSPLVGRRSVVPSAARGRSSGDGAIVRDRRARLARCRRRSLRACFAIIRPHRLAVSICMHARCRHRVHTDGNRMGHGASRQGEGVIARSVFDRAAIWLYWLPKRVAHRPCAPCHPRCGESMPHTVVLYTRPG